MTRMQAKIAEIMAGADLAGKAKELHDEIAGMICDRADAIAIARCAELGVEDMESHEAQKIYRAAERTLVSALLRHVKTINDVSNM